MNKKELKRTNLYKHVKANINEQMTIASLSGVTTLLWLSGTGVFEYQMITQMIENPKYLLTIPVSLVALAVGSLATVLSTGVTIDILKTAKEMINFKKEIEEEYQNDNEDNLSSKFKTLEKTKTYSWSRKR